KVGGKSWRTLVKEGILANDPIIPSKPLFTGNTIEEAKAKKAELMGDVQISEREDNIEPAIRKLKPNHFPARRGKMIVEVAKTPRQEEIAGYTAQCASRTLHKHIDQLSETLEDSYDDMDDESLREFENNLKNLILEEMISGDGAKPPTRNTRIRQKKYVEPPYAADTDYELESELGDEEELEEKED
ncbi:MAG: hypothetical protein KAS32_00905, partial [Candidatus Peribacteraceae bacterium]|nr:hypothetical protein [Candidatus Peribacteraceae bacterium]